MIRRSEATSDTTLSRPLPRFAVDPDKTVDNPLTAIVQERHVTS